MKGKLRFKLIQIYTSVVNSISFLPTLICLFYFFLVITFLIMHSLGMDYKLKESIPFFEIQGAETARAVITSMLTGLISLSVFSFSTVMVVINQASSNYSPKVIEGLINNRSNQYILGVYIGSILYLLIVLLQVADYDEYNIPHLAILFGILTSMYCLVLFVQFIHSISTSVKISSIIERIYTSTKKQIEDKKNVNNINFIIKMEIGEWFPYSLPKSGYFQRIMLNNLKKITWC